MRDEDDWGRHVEYIHWNPVKPPQYWRWPSIHRCIASGLIVPDWPAGREMDLPNVQEE